MTAKIIDGKRISEEVKAEVEVGVKEMKIKHGIVPGLAVVLVGDDPASAVYVRNKKRDATEVWMLAKDILLPESVP